MADRPPPRRRLSAPERRRRILAAAQEVFAQRGYHGSSLDEIARASGTSKALIYEHFESKRALHDALLEEHAGALFERFQANAATGATAQSPSNLSMSPPWPGIKPRWEFRNSTAFCTRREISIR